MLSIDLCVQEYVTEADNKIPLKGAHASLKSGLTIMEAWQMFKFSSVDVFLPSSKTCLDFI